MGTAVSSPYTQQFINSACPEPDQSSPNPPPLHIFRIYFNIILLYTIRSCKWPLYIKFTRHKNLQAFILPAIRAAHRTPKCAIKFCMPNCIWHRRVFLLNSLNNPLASFLYYYWHLFVCLCRCCKETVAAQLFTLHVTFCRITKQFFLYLLKL